MQYFASQKLGLENFLIWDHIGLRLPRVGRVLYSTFQRFDLEWKTRTLIYLDKPLDVTDCSPWMHGATNRGRIRSNLRRLAMRRLAAICFLLAFLSGAAAADDTKPEDIVAKHLDSIATADVRAAVKSRGIQGTLHFRELVGGMGDVVGNWGYVSEGRKSNFVMKFGNGPWHGERFAFDGEKTSFAAFTSSHRPSPFGDFVFTQDYLIKEGWLGGELSTAWALENQSQKPLKLNYAGLKKIDGRDLHCIEYSSKANSDLSIRLYFDPDTYRHMMTVYSLVWQPGIGPDARSGPNQRQIRYTIEERFSDFQTDNGITLPHHYDLRYTQEPQNGATRAYDFDMTADKIFTNISADPANFQIK
jgi:hypothetical protein